MICNVFRWAPSIEDNQISISPWDGRAKLRSGTFEQLEVTAAADSGGAQNIFDNEHGKRVVPGNHDRPLNSFLTEDHVIAMLSNKNEPLQI